MAERLRIVFMGSDPVALPLLDWLAGAGSPAAELVGVFTGADRPSGRGQEVRPNAVGAWASGRPLEVRKPARLDADAADAMRALRPDVALVVAYGHILRDDFIAIPRLGTLNVHASLLPRLRGASPIQTAVASGMRETGLSLMRIVRELDAGPVADTQGVPIGALDTSAEVEARLADAAIPLLARALPLLASGGLQFREQDRGAATFCRRLAKADGILDFSAPAAALAARVNGLNPWPGVAIRLGGVPVKLGLADTAASAGGGQPGAVLGSDAEGLLVAAGSGVLRIRRLQRPGGRMLEARDFLRGFPVPAGTLLESAPMPALVSDAPLRG
ncbi:MAG TPA: methionyl-tRNA formyltransferase [Opitutaceae bacterium]|jgi:methionyl-tRNA formyltransferase